MSNEDEPTIVRAPDSDPTFVMRCKAAQDSSMSFAARGVLAFIFSYPPSRALLLEEIAQAGGISMKEAHRYVAGLRRKGYIE